MTLRLKLNDAIFNLLNDRPIKYNVNLEKTKIN